MTLTLLTVFMGSLLAFREPVLKRLAYSTVSQVSYILFGLSVLQPEAMSGALMHVVFHTFIKCIVSDSRIFISNMENKGGRAGRNRKTAAEDTLVLRLQLWH
ncbi:MAG: proton-conducting transporter membrane subunit [Gallintestinimicrobium sp.]